MKEGQTWMLLVHQSEAKSRDGCVDVKQCGSVLPNIGHVGSKKGPTSFTFLA
jgi:hypothetical protein